MAAILERDSVSAQVTRTRFGLSRPAVARPARSSGSCVGWPGCDPGPGRAATRGWAGWPLRCLAPGGDPVLVQQVRPVQVLDHELDGVPCVAGQPVALRRRAAAFRRDLPGERDDRVRLAAEIAGVGWI